MKTLNKIVKINNLALLTISLVFLASCSSTKYSSGTDDVYYNKSEAPAQPQVQVVKKTTVISNDVSSDEYGYSTGKTRTASDSMRTDNTHIQRFANNNSYSNSQYDQANQPVYSDSSSYRDKNGNVYITNNYYDYEYASRIRRFQHPEWGYGYYDDYFTNSYWYNYDPYMWGTSIYMGYNWWYPSYCYYRPSWYFGLGYGWGGFGFGFGYNPFYSPWGWGGYPYYGYGWGGYPYDYGYYYYNSFDRGYSSGYHYGRRPPVHGTGGHRNVPHSSGSAYNSTSFGEKYQNYLASNRTTENAVNFNKTVIRDNNLNTQNLNKVTNNNLIKNNSNQQVKKFVNPNEQNNVISRQGNQTMHNNTKLIQNNNIIPKNPNAAQRNMNPIQQNNNIYKQHSNPVQKYSKPGYSSYRSIPQMKYAKPNYSAPKTYTSPSYTQPKSGQYYSNPRFNSMPGNTRSYNYQNNSTPSHNYNYSAPSRNYNYSTPSRSYSSPAPAPSRSYSSPAPSRSYSSPSPSYNSGGGSYQNSGSRSSGSSGSSGHRR